jgi:hypothetical protein
LQNVTWRLDPSHFSLAILTFVFLFVSRQQTWHLSSPSPER